MPVTARDSQYGTGAVGWLRQWHGRHTLRSARQRFPSRVLGLDRKVGPGTADLASPTRSDRFHMPGRGAVAERRAVPAAATDQGLRESVWMAEPLSTRLAHG